MWPPPLRPPSVSVPQIGFQGAKEPLDGHRLEVYPGINVSEIQDSALFIRVPEEPASDGLSVRSAPPSSLSSLPDPFLLDQTGKRVLMKASPEDAIDQTPAPLGNNPSPIRQSRNLPLTERIRLCPGRGLTGVRGGGGG